MPKTNGLKGLEAAIAAGYYAKSLNNGFSVLETLDDSDSLKIRKYLKLENIKVMPSNKPYRLYIELEGYDISGNRAKVALRENILIFVIKSIMAISFLIKILKKFRLMQNYIRA